MNNQRESRKHGLTWSVLGGIVAVLTLMVAGAALLNDRYTANQTNIANATALAIHNSEVRILSEIATTESQNPRIGPTATAVAARIGQLESTLAALTGDRGKSNVPPVQATVDIPTFTPPPTGTPVPTQVPPKPTADAHPGEVNLLESNKPLPVGWATNGQYTYWEGFLRVQDEPFIDITVADCGDDEGNGRLDIVQIFNPDGTLAVNERNCDGNPKYRVRTYQKPGYYRIFLQDNDTGGHNGNGGTLGVEMLKDQTIYKNLP
jgi:hypothetical protein